MRKMILLITIMISLILSGCGSSGLYESNSSGYTNLDCVKGAVFDMPASILSQATAVTNISEDTDYDGNIYSYKNGTDTYLLFEISSIVVMVKSGTTFHFGENKKKQEALTSSSMNGIWFTPDGDTVSYIEGENNGINKTILTVNADVSITKSVYGMFSGKLATVESNGQEVSLFIGARADSYSLLTKDQINVIDHVAKSLVLTGETEVTEISIAENTESTEESTTEETSEEYSPIKEIEPEESHSISIEEPITIIEIDENTETEERTEESESQEPSIESEAESVSEEESESEEVIEIIEVEEPSSEEASTEEQTEETKEEPTIEETVSEPVSEPSGEEKGNSVETEESTIKPAEEASSEPEGISDDSPIKPIIVQSNQKENDSDMSSIYSMLEIGETGRMSSLSYNTGMYTDNSITINKLYTGKDAIKIIQKFCDSEESLYLYQDAPAGCSWHVIEYTLSDLYDSYTNICIEGMDGESLRYRGVAYSKRTHDIFYKAIKGKSGYEQLYCYYAVPNGCKEYMLEIGDPGVSKLNAYYKVTGY